MHLEKDLESIAKYLHSQDFLEQGESVETIETPGDGNMNFTLRVITGSRSFIVKQSRPFVEKYPQVAAPEDRTQREAEFYHLLDANKSMSDMTPNLLHVDGDQNVIIMSDLGAGSDYSRLYNREGVIEADDMEQIVSFIARLHTQVTSEKAEYKIENHSMRKLNHEHMYQYPFMEDNGFNLDDVTPGLQALSMKYKKDAELKSKVDEIGQRYLADGDVLLHGDYFPGSWLRTKDGIKIIDPEFCFFGYPEFELGVMKAHLMLCRQDEGLIQHALDQYEKTATYDKQFVEEAAGVEILRRLLGLAQLPVNFNLEEKDELLQQAYKMVLQK